MITDDNSMLPLGFSINSNYHSRNQAAKLSMAMAREGASISVVDTNAENANETAHQIEKENRNALPIIVDVTIKSQVAAMVIKTIKQFGKVDILVNNAGILAVEPIISMKEKTWDVKMTISSSKLNARAVICRLTGMPTSIKSH